MKTCKNCGTINQAIVEKCTSCHMEGHFTLHAAATETVIETDYEAVECANCGSHQSTETKHCTECRFPMAHAVSKPISKLAHLNRRVG